MKFRECCGRNVNLRHASTCPARIVTDPSHPGVFRLRLVHGVQTLAWSDTLRGSMQWTYDSRIKGEKL